MQKLRQWLIDTYNGLYVIVIKPYMPNAPTIIALVVGLIFGLIWAYGLQPVEFYDAAPYRLSEGYREEWVKFVAAAHAANIYDDQAIINYLNQVENPSGVIQDLLNDPGGPEGTQRIALQNIQGLAAQAQGTPAPRPAGFISELFSWIVPVVLLVVLSVIAVLLWGVFIKPNVVDAIREKIRPKTDEDRARAKRLEDIKRQRLEEEALKKESAQAAATNPYGVPVTQKLPEYVKGRSFDESYAIETESDEFLGEFGATIAKTIGDTNEPCAIEIWLFDKDDFVRTLTKVFLTEHAYNDLAIRSDLENRVDDPDNDFIIARPGATIQLETTAILVKATITRLEFGSEGLLPPNSYFKDLKLQMEAWDKKGAGAAVPIPTPAMATPAGQGMTPPPYTPPPQPTFTPPSTPPATPPPYTPPPPPSRPASQDDDPFGGTGDFTPIGGS
jgi:hypothetical protein